MSHRAELFPYQRVGAEWLSMRTHGLLCDEMGLGKTPQAIAAADMAGLRRILVLAPAAVRENWRREFLRWQSTARTARIVRSVDDVGQADVSIVSYDLARSRPVLNALLARTWDLLVCDEAHYLKNPTSARTRAVLEGLAPAAGRAWGLTGTPMPNDATELWSLFKAFGPEALEKADGTTMAYWPFRKAYCVEIPMGNTGRSKIVGVRNKDDLKARAAKVVLRRKKVDVLKDLPPLREGEMPLPHDGFKVPADDPETADLVRRIQIAVLVSNDVEKDVGRVIQDASGDSVSRLRRLTASVKARVLAPLLVEEMEQRADKLVVMGWHRDTLDVLVESLSRFGAVRLSGDTPQAQRQVAIDRFQDDPTCRVFVGQIQAAGTGITLTAASDLVFAEMSWTPAENAQAAMRVHRVGQSRPVLIRYAMLAGTVDEAVVRTLRRKTADIRAIVD